MAMTRAALHWNAYVDRSPLRRMGHDALVAAVTSLVAKGVGFIKEVLVAATFGLSGALDIYLMAIVLIGFPLSVILNSVQTALIPALATTNDSSAEKGHLYAASALLTLVCLAVLLPLWLMLLPNILPWLAAGFSPEKRQGLEAALFWLIPYYFLNGLNILGYGVLQAKRRYVINGLLPIATPVVTILVLLAWSASPDWRTLVIALMLGSVIECMSLHILLHSSGKIWHLPQDTAELRMIVRASTALLPGMTMLAVGPVVEQAIAAAMGDGTNAALAYGFKFPAALQGILLTAVGITALPYFASQLGQNRAAYCLHSLNKLTIWLLVGGILLIIPLAVFSKEMVTLLYERRAFDAAATGRVAPIQLAYFVQLPFALVGMLGVKTLAALGRNGLVSTYTVVAVLLQCTLAYGLGMLYGAAGIAWAATFVSALLATASYLTARSTLGRLFP